MAKFLTTVGTSFNIEEIIKDATDSLTIVTPYLKLNKTLIERIHDADQKGVKLTLIYGKKELATSEQKVISSFTNLEIYFHKNLHAKCYHNNKKMIITSMNLYEFSLRNNREMGILIEKETDPEIFKDALEEIASIKNASIQEKSFTPSKKSEISTELSIINEGYDQAWNYHLPALYDLLKLDYPDIDIELDKRLYLYNFPHEGINIKISGMIDVTTRNRYKYLKLKRNSQRLLNEELPSIRLFWKESILKIYTEKDYEEEMNDKGLMIHVSKFKKIIDALHRNLKFD